MNYKDPGGNAAVAKEKPTSSTAKETPNLLENLKELVKPPTTKIIPPIVPPPPPPPPPRPPQNTGTKMVVEATGSGGSSDWDVFLCIKLDMQVKSLSLINRIFCSKLTMRATGVRNKLKDETVSELLLKYILDGLETGKSPFPGFVVEGDIYTTPPNCWQKVFGYHDAYDTMFYLGTGFNVDLRKFEFNTSAHRFRVEAWKGNYWNLGAGAEIGFYYDPNESISGDFWKCGYGAYQFKMTLSLLHIPTGTTLYSRSPAETHWWITGFSPRWQDTKVQDLRLTGSVSFSGHPEGNEIYAAFKAKYKTEIGLLEFNDATLTVHIVW